MWLEENQPVVNLGRVECMHFSATEMPAASVNSQTCQVHNVVLSNYSYHESGVFFLNREGLQKNERTNSRCIQP